MLPTWIALNERNTHEKTAFPGSHRCGGPRAGAPAGRWPVRMHVGSQRGPTTPEMLQFFKRHGVDHICGHLATPARGYWTVEELRQTRDLCEHHGISFDMAALPP